MRIPDVPIIPILIIVGFVVYPFAISGIALFIAAKWPQAIPHAGGDRRPARWLHPDMDYC